MGVQRAINNSYFEKSERYIAGMYSDNPTISQQYYSMVEPTGFGRISSGHFTYDGQIFSRTKKNGGNKLSSWHISGTGKTLKEVHEYRAEFRKFKEMFTTLIALNKDPVLDLDELENILKGL